MRTNCRFVLYLGFRVQPHNMLNSKDIIFLQSFAIFSFSFRIASIYMISKQTNNYDVFFRDGAKQVIVDFLLESFKRYPIEVLYLNLVLLLFSSNFDIRKHFSVIWLLFCFFANCNFYLLLRTNGTMRFGPTKVKDKAFL